LRDSLREFEKRGIREGLKKNNEEGESLERELFSTPGKMGATKKPQ